MNILSLLGVRGRRSRPRITISVAVARLRRATATEPWIFLRKGYYPSPQAERWKLCFSRESECRAPALAPRLVPTKVEPPPLAGALGGGVIEIRRPPRSGRSWTAYARGSP